MTRNFECPNCGGSLEYAGGDQATVKCPYCGKTVIVPAELRTQSTETPVVEPLTPAVAAGTGAGNMRSLGAAIVLIIVCAVVVPLAGAGLGIWGAVQSVTTVENVSNTVLPPIVAVATLAIPPTEVPTATPTPGLARLLMKFGSQGTGPGKLNDSRSLAVDAVGNIYVGDYQGGRVQVFDSSGAYISQFLAGGSKSFLFSLAADKKGTVYAVVDGQIKRFEGATDKELAPLEYPDGDRFGCAALTADGGVIAIWYEQRNGLITSIEGHRDDFVRFDASGKVTQVLRGFISSQTGDPELDIFVAPDGLGNIYALAGTFDHGIFSFTREGRYVNRFGASGTGSNDLGNPGSIAIDSQGRIYVGDSSRIHVFDSKGRYIGHIDFPGSVFAVTLDAEDRLYALGNSQVQKLELNQK